MLARSTLQRATQVLRRRYATVSGEGTAFKQERAAVKAHAAQTAQLWRRISLYVAVPASIIFAINAYKLEEEHVAHQTEHPTKFVAYPYRNVHVKDYPWGDGMKTPFWNDNLNHLNEEAE